MSLASIINPDSGSLTIYTSTNCHVINRDHPNYNKLVDALKRKAENEIDALADIPKSISQFTSGKVEIRNDQIFYNGEVLHDNVAQRILQMQSEGFDIAPMISFLELLMENPSYRVIKHLWDFLSQKGIPITEDGHFLCYKAVRHDWMDKHSGTIRNMPGDRPKIQRNKVDDNHHNHCSHGLHCGIMEYVQGFGHGNDRYVLVKVNPKDVIAVPEDANFQKMRVCEYLVVKEITRDTFLENAVYSDSGDELEVEEEDWDSEDWDDSHIWN